jgi:protein gp37
MAERLRSDRFFPNGFDHGYFHDERLREPSDIQKPSGIFIASVSDLMGHWNSDEQIQKVLDVCANNPQHIFFILTKAHGRLLKFEYPPNVWVGVSSPPDFMNGKELDLHHKEHYLLSALARLEVLRNRGQTTFVSFEPLSWNVSHLLRNTLSWAIIGAGSQGPRKIQPDETHVKKLLRVLDTWGTPVYFKENLKWDPIRREFPVQEK